MGMPGTAPAPSKALRAGVESGAEVLALCDTNGGMLPPRSLMVHDVVSTLGLADNAESRVGIPLPQ